jgi:hypothetical protein
MDSIIREATEIKLHLNNMNRDDGLHLSWAHGNYPFTLSEDAGSIKYGIANPHSATRPLLSFLGKPQPLPGPLPSYWSHAISPTPLCTTLCVLLSYPTTLPHIHCSPDCPPVVLIRANYSVLSLSHAMFPHQPAVMTPHLLFFGALTLA